jgi:hypothetical protein
MTTQQKSRFRFSLRELLLAVPAVAAGCMWPPLLVFIVPLLAAAVFSRRGAFAPLLVAAAASMGVGVAASLAYWRYPFHPPRLLSELRDIIAVEQISAVSGVNPARGSYPNIQPLAAIPPRQALRSNAPSGLMPPERILDELGRKPHGIESAKPVSVSLVNAMWQAAEEAEALIESGDPSRTNTKTLIDGYVGIARVSDGTKIAFAAWMGDEHSNDHYPYYEMVFAMDDERPRLVNWQWFFEDIAGIEGATWLSVAIPMFLILSPLALILGAARPSPRRFARRRARRRTLPRQRPED